ncbi:MAG: hypothetical protein JWM04_2202, partial [Verrucomicrobiales bacterium]|nr:hypothetical protein [Verrucomicrobiales bacterium]
AKQTPAQSVEFAFLQLAQPPLQQHAQVVSGDGQVMQRFGAPEIFHRQSFDSELIAQFLDSVFYIGSPVVTAPNTEWAQLWPKIGPESLKPVAGNFHQQFASALGPLHNPLPDQNQAPPNLAGFHFLNFHPIDLRFLPIFILMAAKALKGLSQTRHHNVFQAQAFRRAQKAIMAKSSIGPNQSQPDVARQFSRRWPAGIPPLH